MKGVDVLALQGLDRQYLLHPFTDPQELHRQGTHIITEGRGCWLRDAEGRELLDALAGLWCVQVGYGRREILEAVRAQMERLPYYSSFFQTTTIPTIELAARLVSLAPPRISHCFFSSSGSEANETALKIIRRYWLLHNQPQKTVILSRAYAYHGVTLATASLTGLEACRDPFGLPLADFVQIPAPYRRDGQACLQETEAIIQKTGPERIGALFVEPVQGAGGVILPPPGYVQGLRELCRRYGILVVADEVITGFGRLGQWFASAELDPDLITVAKGLTSGYLPMSATLISREIAADLISAGVFSHGFTYGGHPVCAAAALANLEILERERLIERVHSDIGPYLQAALRPLADHPLVAEVRGQGLIAAIELRNHSGSRAAAVARQEGVIVRGIRDLIALAPPLVISYGEVDGLVAALGRVLDRLGD
ncbi:MAG: aminotransferase class III-fold pyridoxal phosphate-dependent enzyme [Thermostichales cyanobacterium BF4_bins_65]